MDIRTQLREGLILHESNLITEDMDGKIGRIVDSIIKFFKDKITNFPKKMRRKWEIFKDLIGKLRATGRDFRAGKLSKKNPNYDEQARKTAVDTVIDLAKLLAFFGMNTMLNYYLPLLGAGVGALVIFFRKFTPDKIADFLTLAVEKGRDTVTEMLSLLEDMAYYGADDATQDEYSIGVKD